MLRSGETRFAASNLPAGVLGRDATPSATARSATDGVCFTNGTSLRQRAQHAKYLLHALRYSRPSDGPHGQLQPHRHADPSQLQSAEIAAAATSKQQPRSKPKPECLRWSCKKM